MDRSVKVEFEATMLGAAFFLLGGGDGRLVLFSEEYIPSWNFPNPSNRFTKVPVHVTSVSVCPTYG